jgi:hypothetical protein
VNDRVERQAIQDPAQLVQAPARRCRFWPRRMMALLASFVAAGALTSAAWAAYWDYSNYLNTGSTYWEDIVYGPPYTWGIRLSRQYCGTKMLLDKWAGQGYTYVSFPGGCAQGDYSHRFDTFVYYAAECYNRDGPRMWVNCRIDYAL